MSKTAIIIPYYNSEKYVYKTIQHILDQTMSNWELLLVNDGSTDSSEAIVKGFTDPRIRHLNLDKNSGSATARNLALDFVENYSKILGYSYVAFCDSDDLWQPNHLKNSLEELRRNSHPHDLEKQADMVYSDCIFMSGNKEVFTYGIPYYDDFKRENLLKQNFIYISTVVSSIRIIKGKRFDKMCEPMDDYDFWLQISKESEVKHLQEKNVIYTYKENGDGAYYTDEQSYKKQARVHLKHNIISDDVSYLKLQLDQLQDMKNETIRNQKYEDAARLRDVERTLERKLLELLGPENIEGWLTVEEGEALRKYAKGKDCLEIGSYKGKSANYIASSAKSLVCIDTFLSDSSGQDQKSPIPDIKDFLKNTGKFNNIKVVIGKSEDKVNEFKDEQFDFIFLDGMHDYESVRMDIINYFPKLKVNGDILFHDYNNKDFPGVKKAVDEFFKVESLSDSLGLVHKVADLWVHEEMNNDIHLAIEEKSKINLDTKFILMKGLNMIPEEIDKLSLPSIEYLEKELKKIAENFNKLNELQKKDLTKEEDKSLTLNSKIKNKIKEQYIEPNLGKPVVLIFPWAKNLPEGKENPKNLPIDSIKEVVSLLRSVDIYVIQVSLPGERFVDADEIVFSPTPERLKEMLFACDAYISIDSFFPHFAHFHEKEAECMAYKSEKGIKTGKGIVVFGKSDPEIFGYKENTNLLKSRDYLRKEQFWLWTQTSYDENVFVSPNEIFLATIKKILKDE